MTTTMNLFENYVDLDLFNNYLVKNGGRSMKITKPKITLRHFIIKLIKTFKKDFKRKIRKGGMADIYNDSDISYSTNLSDLDFKTSYSFIPYTELVRDVY